MPRIGAERRAGRRAEILAAAEARVPTAPYTVVLDAILDSLATPCGAASGSRR